MRSVPFLLALLGLFTALGCPTEESLDDDDTNTPAVDPPRLKVTHDPIELTELATEAVAVAPAWVRDDLVIALAALHEDMQNELASMLLDVDDHYLIDEMAFVIAHLTEQVLEYWTFYPELVQVNAEHVYSHDAALDYVALVEVGEPGVDDDYHTTVAYQVETEDGSVVERQLDPELYYWYVVHPRLEDEKPLFVDGWTSGDGVEPSEGYHWREFLWDRANDECPPDRECPLLVDAMAGVDVLWKNKQETAEDNGAMGALVDYIHDAMDWGAGNERPIQPNRIYAVGCGNCGEHADISCAAARTALVPCQNVGARSNDHTWDEFWDDGWHGWEPIGTHMDYMGYYKNGVQRDRVDNDCDGMADDALDNDDEDGDGYGLQDGDCDDTLDTIFPGAPEVQNGRDDDCDGVADAGMEDSDLDGDGDGFSISEGDCHDLADTIYPGATEDLVNGIDEDCDGVADDGLDESDADADGFTILMGDCHDGDDTRYPGAVEVANGRDDDCNGIADDGFTDHDRDRDGFTLADGDCNDLSGGFHPDMTDPRLGGNRLYAISTARGDSYISLERTEDYVTLPSYLEAQVTDSNGTPIDGAIVTLYGTWEVYGYPNDWAWAGEMVTGLDGWALATVGETNPYGYAVESRVGNYPGPGSLDIWLHDTVAHETYELTRAVSGEMPPALDATEADLTGGAEPELTMELTFEVESHRIEADGAFFGEYSLEQPGGRVSVYIVDEDNFALMLDGTPFQAHTIVAASDGDHISLDLPLQGDWVVILSNVDTVASTMVGSVELGATPLGDITWTEELEPLSQRFRIPPGEMMVLSLRPPL